MATLISISPYILFIPHTFFLLNLLSLSFKIHVLINRRCFIVFVKLASNVCFYRSIIQQVTSFIKSWLDATFLPFPLFNLLWFKSILNVTRASILRARSYSIWVCYLTTFFHFFFFFRYPIYLFPLNFSSIDLNRHSKMKKHFRRYFWFFLVSFSSIFIMLSKVVSFFV